MTYTAKAPGEKNVHTERMRRQAAKLETADLISLYHRLPRIKDGFTLRQKIVRRELERRNLSLRDLGIDR